MDGALSFLVNLLSHPAIPIVENGGGILRNISSFIATSGEGDGYRFLFHRFKKKTSVFESELLLRSILRKNNCLEVLLHQLKSPSLTIVSNACGTLWNLSARCHEDQVCLLPTLLSIFPKKIKVYSNLSEDSLVSRSWATSAIAHQLKTRYNFDMLTGGFKKFVLC